MGFGSSRTARPDAPTITEATGSNWDYIGDWRGLVAPAGLPEDRRRVLLDALERILRAGTFEHQLRERGFSVSWELGDDFAR